MDKYDENLTLWGRLLLWQSKRFISRTYVLVRAGRDAEALIAANKAVAVFDLAMQYERPNFQSTKAV
ncbi:MAG: hypothetical protein EOM37_05455 [Proteobacteria bacterium]|nr:hypothetical protein [Pseudomonadota bacterium]